MNQLNTRCGSGPEPCNCRQVLECASPLALSIATHSQKRQATGALHDASLVSHSSAGCGQKESTNEWSDRTTESANERLDKNIPLTPPPLPEERGTAEDLASLQAGCRSFTGSESPYVDSYKRLGGLGLAISLYLMRLNRASAEDHVDYRFQSYQEDNGRIGVDTHTWLFDKKVTSWLSLKGDVVYDAIAGATPIGAPPATQIKNPFPPNPPPTPLSDTVPTAYMHDTRWAGSLSSEMVFGPHHIIPQLSYSSEHDYSSFGTALNYSLDLNQKNTTLNAGWAHDWDRHITGTYSAVEQSKDTDHVLVGVNQLLSPKTVLTVNFTFRNSHGYLNDPYRGVLFEDYPQFDLNKPILFPESRPSFRQSYLGFVSLTQFITPLHGSIEGSYRYSYDTYDISAHTVELFWHQKITNRVLLSPFFRYYRQTAASFYGTQFAGDPSNPFDPTPIPAYYSADYRLSKMETYSVGVDVSARITRWLSLNASYMRYGMYGLDGVTAASMYPKANVVTIGASLWF